MHPEVPKGEREIALRPSVCARKCQKGERKERKETERERGSRALAPNTNGRGTNLAATCVEKDNFLQATAALHSKVNQKEKR